MGSNLSFELGSFVAWTTVILLVCCLVGCGGAPDDTAIQVQLNWYPDAQFGGFYAAEIHGEYVAEGLNVRILSGGPDVTVLPKLAMRRVDFAVGNADQVLLARKEGADVVAVMSSMQDSPRCIMVHKKSGIDAWEKLRGVTLAIGEGNPFAEFLKSKLALDDIRIVAYAGSVAKFLVDDKFAQQGYVFSEPVVARQRGSDPLALMVSDLGFNPYTGLVITNRSLIEQHPDVVRRFVRATIRGWQHYLADPEITNQEICRLNAEMDMDSLAQAVDVIRPLCIPAGSPGSVLGKMNSARWNSLAAQMQELGLISQKDAADATKAYSTAFF